MFCSCLYPSTIVNPHYKVNVFELLDGVFPEDYYITIPCGKCPICRKTKANGWKFRLLQEVKYTNKDAYFLTLTFSDRYYKQFKDKPENAIRRFLERYRRRFKVSLRHWFVTELGCENGRLHFHGIVFFDRSHYYMNPSDFLGRVVNKQSGPGKYGSFQRSSKGTIKKFNRFWRSIWKYGNTWVDIVRPETVGYVVKYIMKPSDYDPSFTPKVFVSPGLGKEYINNSPKLVTPCTVIQYDGSTFKLPAYLSRKLINQDVRKAYLRKNWLDPPSHIVYFLGKEYNHRPTAESVKRAFADDYAQIRKKKSLPPIKTYSTALPPIDLIDRTYAYGTAEEIFAMERQLTELFTEKWRIFLL